MDHLATQEVSDNNTTNTSTIKWGEIRMDKFLEPKPTKIEANIWEYC
jgi:hypothetical protein